MKRVFSFKRFLTLLLAFVMLLSAGCASASLAAKTTVELDALATDDGKKNGENKILPETEGSVADKKADGPSLNGWALSEFTIVYSEKQPDYTARAAIWLQNEIEKKTGVKLPVSVAEKTKPSAHEIVVGETDRDVSKALDAETEGMELSYLARKGHVAMEGDSFVIAAAAYRFAQDYLNGENVPAKITVADPIAETPKNFILLIGDGMGQNHTKLFDAYQNQKVVDYTDGEASFYGHLFPYQGLAVTNNVKGSTTDSAASATALATGVKTTNGRIGKDADGKDLVSITEIAASKGMATAIMSTEVSSGATPAAFSAHALDRDDTEEILASQKALAKKRGTIVSCKYNVYTAKELEELEKAVVQTLDTLFSDPDGSFMMYEEAYIDKHSHNNDLLMAYKALARFDQVIGLVMEQAFYHPETMVVITADHETGGIVSRGKGKFNFSETSHTNFKVPVFAYGQGAEVFDDKTVENVQIPKTLVKMMGGTLASDTDAQYPPLF